MSIWVLVQVGINLILLLSVGVLWLRLKRPPKDDPRLSRGLQLLQSKITVLEDLSDRTDRQVKQLTQLLDQKSRLLQSKIFEAENQIQKVNGSMDRSMEVAKIFQDKIPHDEIIERKNTIRYVTAARMAHSGKTVDEIEREVDLPREQIEFIQKVNQEKLMFEEENLPAWVDDASEDQMGLGIGEEDYTVSAPNVGGREEIGQMYSAQSLQSEAPNYESLKRLGNEFREACKDFETQNLEITATPTSKSALKAVETLASSAQSSQLYSAAKSLSQKLVNRVDQFMGEDEPAQKVETLVVSDEVTPTTSPIISSEEVQALSTPQVGSRPVIKKVIFPSLDDNSFGSGS